MDASFMTFDLRFRNSLLQVYICDVDCDINTASDRNIHGRTLSEVAILWELNLSLLRVSSVWDNYLFRWNCCLTVGKRLQITWTHLTLEPCSRFIVVINSGRCWQSYQDDAIEHVDMEEEPPKMSEKTEPDTEGSPKPDDVDEVRDDSDLKTWWWRKLLRSSWWDRWSCNFLDNVNVEYKPASGKFQWRDLFVCQQVGSLW